MCVPSELSDINETVSGRTFTSRRGHSSLRSLREPRQLSRWMLGLVIGFCLAQSAISHLRNPYAFLGAVEAYDLTPGLCTQALAAYLPFLHLMLAGCFITGYAPSTSFGVATWLFFLYSITQTVAVWRGLHIDCGCFGRTSFRQEIDWQSVGIALACALLSAIGWFISPIPNDASAKEAVATDDHIA